MTTTTSTGAQRRVQALIALGWTIADLAPRLEFEPAHLERALAGPADEHPIDSALVVETYDELSMTLGPCDLTRQRAVRAGWAPPLAWDEETLDDPTRSPEGVRTASWAPSVTLDALAEMACWGLTTDEAAVRLGVSSAAVTQAMRRHKDQTQETSARFRLNRERREVA